MERYKVSEELGDGTCGNVYKAVAVNRMKRKYYHWEECVNLREVKSLRRLNHTNIIKLLEIVRQNKELFFISEYMECNLYQIKKNQQRSFSEEEIRAFMSQVLQGLSHVHKHGYFHWDRKPDMWAVGAILTELFNLCPIFPGESLCTPEWNPFPEATNISRLVDITYSDIQPANLSDIIPNATPEAIDLIKQLFSWDPLRRLTADQCLQHPFLHVTLGCSDEQLHFFVEMVRKNRGANEGLMICPSFIDQSQQSVFRSLFPTDHHVITTVGELSLSLPFRVSTSEIYVVLQELIHIQVE